MIVNCGCPRLSGAVSDADHVPHSKRARANQAARLGLAGIVVPSPVDLGKDSSRTHVKAVARTLRLP